ncbi:hypothetical protein [Terrimonas ferruginea]|uniref:hypothetical protein n=1 Tax=Terrimonas ferruginea TaxID=249 RepID=UPI000405BD93|nr:hypothetical protein [Terrimonas ferruginea]
MQQRVTLLLCLFFFATAIVRAQNMNSPYSIYGIGDIDHRSYNRTAGLAGTGIATRSSIYLVDNNPAAITGLTRSFYTIDAAMAARTVTYSGTPVSIDNSKNKDFWIKRLSLAVKVNGFWATSAGFSQFSNVNYTFTGEKGIIGDNTTYQTRYEGDGGLNEYYWTNAVSLGKHFSVGLRSAIVAGGFNKTEIVSDAGLGSSVSTQVQEYFGRPRFQAGAQYYTALGKKWALNLGGRYTPGVNLPSERTLTVTEGTTTLVDAKTLEQGNFRLPKSYAAGISLTHNRKTTYLVDYTYDDWSSLQIKKQGWQMVSSSRLSGGVEFSRKKNVWNQEIEHRFFQLGGFYNQSYLQIRNQPIREYGFTAGMGGILSKGLLYSVSLEGGVRGTQQANLIKENYFQLNFSFSYRDFLQSRGRKYD